ncbi:hypothetical protein FGO68_gene8608 [Halteria grandinella]|uniref:Uncharacterized protein n=1 Tax=Halteria grandinella TaxID=5974 RepID=A0A8J8T9R3_HALGN|nr:hypothetical protein FGO68_gene8608 [Halteria grandinella]
MGGQQLSNTKYKDTPKRAIKENSIRLQFEISSDSEVDRIREKKKHRKSSFMPTNQLRRSSQMVSKPETGNNDLQNFA